MTASRVSTCEALSGDTTTRNATVADKVHSTTQDNVSTLRTHGRGPEEVGVNIRLYAEGGGGGVKTAEIRQNYFFFL